MVIISPLEETSFEKVLQQLHLIPNSIQLHHIIDLLIKMNILHGSAKASLQSAVRRFGYHILKEQDIVLALPVDIIYNFISSPQLRCDEGTVIQAVFIKYRQLLDNFDTPGMRMGVEDISAFMTLLDCVDPARLRLSDRKNQYWTNLYKEMTDKFDVTDREKICIPTPRATGYKEVLTIYPYRSINPAGDSVGFKSHRMSGSGPEFNLTFSVGTRKLLRKVWFGGSIPKSTRLANKDMTVVCRLLMDDHEQNIYCAHSKDVIIDANPDTRCHGESIGMNFDHLELFPGREYCLESTLTDVGCISSGHLTIITVELLY